MCIGSQSDFLIVRNKEYEFKSLLLETELVGMDLGPICVAALAVGSAQRA